MFHFLSKSQERATLKKKELQLQLNNKTEECEEWKSKYNKLVEEHKVFLEAATKSLSSVSKGDYKNAKLSIDAKGPALGLKKQINKLVHRFRSANIIVDHSILSSPSSQSNYDEEEVISTENYIDAIPEDVHIYILRFLPVEQLLKMSRISRYWHKISQKEALWKDLFAVDFPEFPPEFTKEKYIHTYKVVREVVWDEKFIPAILKITGNVVSHYSGATEYGPLRTKKGYTKGKHYWDVTLLTCTLEGFNSYVGIGLKNLSNIYHLGSCNASWAFKVGTGELYKGGRAINKSLLPDGSSVKAKNGNVIGVLLDLDKCTLRFFIDDVATTEFHIPELKGKEVYPAISMIATPDSMSTRFNLPIPNGF